MKTLKTLITLSLFFVLAITGCSNKAKYIELNKETVAQLNLSEVMEVDLVSTVDGKEPKKWRSIYRDVFPITDSEKISLISQCIKEGKTIDYYTDRKLLFKTKKVVYYLGIGWDDKLAYGDWWESPELLKNFESWGLTHPKGESNLPKGQIWDKAPYERDPNM